MEGTTEEGEGERSGFLCHCVISCPPSRRYSNTCCVCASSNGGKGRKKRRKRAHSVCLEMLHVKDTETQKAGERKGGVAWCFFLNSEQEQTFLPSSF